LSSLAFPDSVQLRAGDALHLELALASGCRTVVTFDRRLANAGKENGLFVFPD
jgi:predicted nucleic acid-binding protein